MSQIVFRKRNIEVLESLVMSLNCKRIFLVRGNNSYKNSGAKIFIDSLFNDVAIISFSDFAINPQLSDVKKGVELFRENKCDLVVAIGGGSALDIAKLISVFAHQEKDLKDIVLGKAEIVENKTPMLAIPTTAGTGAEATQFAVLYINKTKYSVGHSVMLPEYVFLSPDFSLSADKYLTACTGLDAFCQAVESVWSVNANTESLEYALEAISLIWDNLQKAVNENDVLAKESMQEASFLAGKAINITKTTAPHALSYAFTSYYGIPHGHAVALSLPFFVKYNYGLNKENCIDKRGVEAVKGRIELILNILGLNKENISDEFIKFFNQIDININLTEINNLETNIIVDNVNFERLSNNPRKVSKEDILNFLNQKK